MSPEVENLYDLFLNSGQEAERVLSLIDAIPDQQLLRDYRGHRHPQFPGKRIAGLVFEIIASGFVKATTPDDQAFLSPAETAELYSVISPLTVEDSGKQINSGVRNTRCPDGFILNRSNQYWQITGLCEYKLTGAGQEKDALRREGLTRRLIEQMHDLSSNYVIESGLGLFYPEGRAKTGVMLHRVRPDLDPYPLMLHPRYRLTYVFPNNSSIPELIGKTPARVRMVHLPFNTRHFGQFLDHLFDEALATRPV